MDINALVEEKIEADVDFQASLADLEDDDREAAISAKKSEVLSNEFTSLKEQADKAAKAQELADNYKIRAEKAEKGSKEHPAAADTETKAPALSASDIVALSKVDEDDIERVEKFAADNKVSIKEALKDDELKAILGVRAEKRASANAANTGPVRRGPSALTDDALLDKASKGDLPDSDDAIERLMKAKAKQK